MTTLDSSINKPPHQEVQSNPSQINGSKNTALHLLIYYSIQRTRLQIIASLTLGLTSTSSGSQKSSHSWNQHQEQTTVDCDCALLKEWSLVINLTAPGAQNSSSSRANYTVYVVARLGSCALQFARSGWETGRVLWWGWDKPKNGAVVLHSTEVFLDGAILNSSMQSLKLGSIWSDF